MANAFENPTLVTKLAIEALENELQMGKQVTRNLDEEFGKKVGDTIFVRRNQYFSATDGATLSVEDIQDGTVPVQLTERKHVAFEITTQDMTLEVDELRKRYVIPAMQELAQNIETFIGSKYTDIYNFVGNPGTRPSTFLDVGEGGTVMSELGVPMTGDWVAFFEPRAALSIANGLKGVFPEDIASRALREAAVGRYAKFTIFENQSLATHTVGVNTGTPLVNGASQNVTYLASKNTWSQSLITDGWTNDQTDILKAGDVFTIAGVNAVNRGNRLDTGQLAQFTVLADADSGSTTGPATFTISPPIITSGSFQTVTAAPANDAVITVLTGDGGTSHKQNLSFHPNAFVLAMVPLDLPRGGAESARETHEGISIRTVIDYDVNADKNIFRFDVLYGVKAQNPDFATRTTS